MIYLNLNNYYNFLNQIKDPMINNQNYTIEKLEKEDFILKEYYN